MDRPEVIIIPSFFLMVGYVVWVTVTAWHRKQRLRMLTDFNTRLLDRLGSVKDFSDFLQTSAGAKFLQDLASEPAPVFGAQERILRAAQFGTVLVFLGLGLLTLSFFWSPYAPEAGQNAFATLGTISLSLGLGFMASAVASYRLAGTLGLLPKSPGASHAPVESRS